MKILEIKTKKKLVLKNVLKRELKNIHTENLDVEVEKFALLLEKLNVQTFGPFVMKTGGIHISEEGLITMDYDLLTQAHDYKQYKNAFDVSEKFEVPNCVYVKFEGNPEELHYAHSKLDLHFYENELESTGEVYSVIIEETQHYTVVDIFKPVKQL